MPEGSRNWPVAVDPSGLLRPRWWTPPAARYGLTNPGRLIAAGYSNGVNVAYAMPLLQPGVLAAAVLFRAMPPTPPD